jgi:hypothetical protein
MPPSCARSAATVLLVAISACSSSGDSGTTITAQPIDSAPAQSTPANAADGGTATFGVPTKAGDLRITASDPVIESDADGPWLTLNVLAENRSPNDVQSPLFELRCSGDPTGGAWLPTSTFKAEETVASGSSAEGKMSLLIPGDVRDGNARRTCAMPATVVARLLAFDNEGSGQPVRVKVEWAVPDELVAELNSAS